MTARPDRVLASNIAAFNRKIGAAMTDMFADAEYDGTFPPERLDTLADICERLTGDMRTRANEIRAERRPMLSVPAGDPETPGRDRHSTPGRGVGASPDACPLTPRPGPELPAANRSPRHRRR